MTTMRSLGRPLRRSSSIVDRKMTHRETEKRMAKDPIIIFSMGRTGTTSLTDAIVSATDRPLLKAHALSADGIARRLAKSERLGINRRPRHLWQCEQIAQSLRSTHPRRILSGVRDPIAVATSDHFYGLARQRETNGSVWMTGDLGDHAQAVERNLRDNFIDRDWFRDELLPATGIDVYNTPFPAPVGRVTLHNANYCALILRAENLASIGAAAVADHFDLPELTSIPRQNRTFTSNKSPYRDFLARGRLNHDLIDEVYQTRLARHFYSPEELTAFTRRWKEGQP